MSYEDTKRDRIFERIAGSLERIADALEKQNAGTIEIDGNKAATWVTRLSEDLTKPRVSAER